MLKLFETWMAAARCFSRCSTFSSVPLLCPHNVEKFLLWLICEPISSLTSLFTFQSLLYEIYKRTTEKKPVFVLVTALPLWLVNGYRNNDTSSANVLVLLLKCHLFVIELISPGVGLTCSVY